MGKKSAIDQLRDEFAQRAMRQRNALGGPFMCPKCLTHDKMECQTTLKNVKEDYTPASGETRKVNVRYKLYLFSCKACRFKKVLVRDISRITPSVIDVYNNLYDEELSSPQRKIQIAMIRERKFKTIELPACEVKMR